MFTNYGIVQCACAVGLKLAMVSTMLLLLLVVTVCCDAHSEPQHNGSRLLVTSDQPLVWSESNGYIVAPQGATVELTCRPVGRPLPPHTTLQWWEEAPVMSGPNREVIPTQGCGVMLRLANITVSDYGRYRCKCVQKEHNFNEGIQFNLQWTQQCSLGEQLVTVLPGYEPTLWVPEVSRRQYQNRPGANARLQCHSQWNSSSTHWTVVTSDDSVRLSANGGAIRPVRNPRTDTKYICHNGAGDHVYSIYYLSGPPPKAEIVFPPSDMDYVDILYTDNELIESEGIIHLCLIQPYTSSSSIKYKSANNRTVSSTATTTASLSPSGALLLEAKLLSDGLLYFVRVMENKRDMDKVIRRTVEGGVFTCAVNKKNKVSFKLNLTAAQHSRSTRPPHEDSCYSTNNTRHRHRNRVSDPIRGPRFNSSRPVRPPRPENNTIPRIPKPLKIGSKYNTSTPRVPKPPRGTTIPPPLVVNVSTSEPVSATDVAIVHRGSIVTLLSIGGGLVMAIVIAVVIGLCAFRYIHRKQIHKMHKMSPVSNKSSLHSSFSNPLFNIIEADVPKTTILGKLQSQGLVYPFTLLRVCGELGSGAFGVVMQADLFDPLTQTTSTVAVKMLKDLATVEDERDLMMELKTLVRIGKHPNVLSFLGATINQGKLCLIVEYCEGGCLLELLRAKRLDTEEPLTISTMLEMASQIANGMAYLSSKKCLHRDLAARNVLITGQCTLKVGDFGLARKLYHSVYRPTPKRLPIKWMGPEGILDGVYTSKSDVWSFGVLLWEIFTLGRTPYPGIPTHSVIRAIQTGYRMLQPSACPDQVYNVMLCCWQIDPLLRPDFVELKTVFDSMFSEHTGQCYYNLQECDCSSESDYSLQEVDVDYVNVLPRGWFSSGDSVGVFMQGHLEENRLGARLEEGSLCSEFMQGHLEEEGSLCSECECNEPSDLISVNSQASLCTECELQELQLYTTS